MDEHDGKSPFVHLTSSSLYSVSQASFVDWKKKKILYSFVFSINWLIFLFIKDSFKLFLKVEVDFALVLFIGETWADCLIACIQFMYVICYFSDVGVESPSQG